MRNEEQGSLESERCVRERDTRVMRLEDSIGK